MESEMESREPLNQTTAEQGEDAGRAGRLEELEEDPYDPLPGPRKTKGTRMLMPKNEDGLKWEEVVKELKSLFKFNADPDRGWWTIVKTSLIILSISVLPSFFDMGSDAFSVYSFINGTTYTKYVPDLNHSSFNSSLCTHVGTYLRRKADFSEVAYEEVECFEKDPIWGYMSLAFIFLPGIGGVSFWDGLTSLGGSICLSCLSLPVFPLIVITVKTIGLFNPGPNWKILAGRCAALEGSFESRFQFLLQLFIVFTRADRAPSTVQLATMASSVIMIAISQLNDIRRRQKTLELGDDIQRAVSLLPQILVKNVAQIGCAALLATLLRYWVLIVWLLSSLPLYVCGGFLKWQKRYRFRVFGDGCYRRVSVGQIEMSKLDIFVEVVDKIMFLSFILTLIGLTITANVYPSLTMPGFYWEVGNISLF